MIKVICKQCGEEFETYPSIMKKGKGKYCSKKCYGISQQGKTPWNKIEKVNIICKKCNKTFVDYNKRCRKYCCKKCADMDRITLLKNECKQCGKIFDIKPFQNDHGIGNYCSSKCFYSRNVGDKNSAWKGEHVGYQGIHRWIYNHFGKACRCDNPDCVYPRKNSHGKYMLYPKIYTWANVSGEYKRDISDWMQLCPSCHTKFDQNGHNF
jgi:hypothetical protein